MLKNLTLALENPLESGRFTKILLGFSIGLILLFSGIHTTFAVSSNLTWVSPATFGGDGVHWSDANNWLLGGMSASPAPGDNLIFPTGIPIGARSNMINDLALGFQINNITFQDNGYVINPQFPGSNLMITGNINDQAVGGQNDINMNLYFQNTLAQGITSGFAGHTLNINNLDLNGNNLILSGQGVLIMMGVISDSSATPTAGITVNSADAHFDNANTYHGPTTINYGGIIFVSNNNSLGIADGTDATGTTVLDGGQLLLNGAANLNIVNEKLTLNGYGPSSNGVIGGTHDDVWDGPIILNTDSRVNQIGASLTLGGANGNISGTGGINKIGTGVLILPTNNTYAGVNYINGGTLETTSLNGLGQTGFLTDTYVASGASLKITSDGNINNEALYLSGNGTAGSGALLLTGGGTVGWEGPFALDANSTVNCQTAFDRISTAQSISGAFGLTKDGLGSMSIAAGNIYTGATNIHNGTLSTTAPAAIPDTSAVTIDAGATLDLNNNNETIGSLSGVGNIELGVGATPSTLTVNEGVDTTYSGIISGAHGSLNKAGSAVLSLSNNNTYGGNTTITAGKLKKLGDFDIIPDGSTLDIKSTGTFDLNDLDERIFSLKGDAGATITSPSHTLYITTTDALVSNTFAGTLTGNFTINKQGPGKMVFTDNSPAYTGSIYIGGGSCIVDGDHHLSMTTVAAVATLGGTGSTSNTYLNANSIFAPGDTTGIFHSQLDFTADTSHFRFEINGTTVGTQYDQLNVTGTVDLGGTTTDLQLTVDPAFTPTIGSTYTIITSTGAITGTFNGKANASLINVGGKYFVINYSTNVVTLTGSNASGQTVPSTPPVTIASGNGGGCASICPLENPTGSSSSSNSSTQPSTPKSTTPVSPKTDTPTLHPSADTTTTPSSQKFYTDVSGHRAEQDILELLDSCKVAGYQDEQGNFLKVFRPDNQITRAELLTMIIKCKVGPLDAPSQAPFSDVPANHWSAPYIAKGLELGIIKGYEDGSFKPNQTVSKAEALKAVLLSWNTLKDIESSSAENSCKDVKPTAWYAKYFTFALKNDLLADTTNCQPETKIRRADATILVLKVRRQAVVPAGK